MAWRWIFCLILSFSSLLATPTAAEPEVIFGHGTLKIGSRSLKIEIAEKENQHERGLMYRRALADDQGMLFIFPSEQPLAFWMKNTFIDLAIGYFDKDKILIDVQEMKAAAGLMDERPPSYPSKAPAMYALEVPKGWFTKHKIKVGSKFTYEASKPAPSKAFKASRHKSGH